MFSLPKFPLPRSITSSVTVPLSREILWSHILFPPLLNNKGLDVLPLSSRSVTGVASGSVLLLVTFRKTSLVRSCWTKEGLLLPGRTVREKHNTYVSCRYSLCNVFIQSGNPLVGKVSYAVLAKSRDVRYLVTQVYFSIYASRPSSVILAVQMMILYWI